MFGLVAEVAAIILPIAIQIGSNAVAVATRELRDATTGGQNGEDGRCEQEQMRYTEVH